MDDKANRNFEENNTSLTENGPNAQQAEKELNAESRAQNTEQVDAIHEETDEDKGNNKTERFYQKETEGGDENGGEG